MNKVQKNIILADYTTFRIGGPAKYFVTTKTKEEIIKAVEFAKSRNLPFFILGGGSNLLVSDKGFEGLVIKVQNTKYQILNTKITVGAGSRLGDLVAVSAEAGLTGLEWAIGIPGTIGGAVKVNAGAFGSGISELVKNINRYDNIILSVELELKKGNKTEIQKAVQEYARKRKSSQPLEYPSAGCVFKNPSGEYAGRLIDQCGLKGKKIGQAMVSEKHANFIINLGKAKASDVIKLIKLIKQAVKDKFNIELEEEIQYLGDL